MEILRHVTKNYYRINRYSPLEGAVASVAVQIVQHRGNVTDGELAAAASAGVSEAMTLEIVAHVAMHILSNYANNLARSEVDFPPVAI